MKITAILSAGLIGAAAILLPTTASAGTGGNGGAQYRTERHVVVKRTHTVRGHHYGWRNNRTRRVCKVTYRHHQRIRRCRTIRVRY